MARRASEGAVAGSIDRVRVTVLAGGVLGLVVGGLGGRLGMLLLRATSPETVRGIESDDGFVIGRVTLFGTVGLLALCTAIGIIGGFAYRLVAPALIGPPWLHQLTAALGAGAVVGSMLVHADGVDFTLLEPTWFAIAVFIAIPVGFGATIGPALDRWDQTDAWVNRGRWRRWLLPIAVVAVIPVFVPVVLIAGVVMVAWDGADGVPGIHRVRSSPLLMNVLRAVWVLVAGLGLAFLVNDIAAIT
jgi:hypothetical protein